MASKGKACSSVEMMIVERFERRKITSSGREFVVGMIIEGGAEKTSIKPCYMNDMNSEACGDLLKLNPKDKLIISEVMGKGGTSINVKRTADVFVSGILFVCLLFIKL